MTGDDATHGDGDLEPVEVNEMSVLPDPWEFVAADGGLLHEQYESNGHLVLFRCRECGYVSMSLGSLHGHIEKHRGYTRFNIQIPFTRTAPANVDELNKLTQIIRVDDTTEISIEEVEGL